MKQWADVIWWALTCATFIAFCHCVRSCTIEEYRISKQPTKATP